MTPEPQHLVVAADGSVSCPVGAHTHFGLYDPEDAAQDTAAFLLRKQGDGFERRSELGGMSYKTAWSPEGRRVACTECQGTDSWRPFNLAKGGIREDL